MFIISLSCLLLQCLIISFYHILLDSLLMVLLLPFIVYYLKVLLSPFIVYYSMFLLSPFLYITGGVVFFSLCLAVECGINSNSINQSPFNIYNLKVLFSPFIVYYFLPESLLFIISHYHL